MLERLFNSNVNPVMVFSETKICSKVYAFLLIKGESKTNANKET